MRVVFADAEYWAEYWIAIANPKDDLHARALEVSRELGNAHLITTDEVLNEFLNYFCKKGSHLRASAVKWVETIRRNPNVTIVPQARESFNRGLRLYEMRLDKSYSMADCVSMETMRERDITDVLTHDKHFVEAGFNALLRD